MHHLRSNRQRGREPHVRLGRPLAPHRPTGRRTTGLPRAMCKMCVCVCVFGGCGGGSGAATLLPSRRGGARLDSQAFERMESDLNSNVGEALDEGCLIYTSGVGLLRGPIREGAPWLREPAKIDVMWVAVPAHPEKGDRPH